MKPLTRCLSDNNIIYLKPLLPSSVVFLKEQKIRDDNDKRPSETAAENIEDLFVSPQNDCTQLLVKPCKFMMLRRDIYDVDITINCYFKLILI